MQRHRSRNRLIGLAATGALAMAGMAALAAPSQGADTQLISNGGFETNTEGWIVNNGNTSDGGTLTRTDQAHTGTGALKISNRLTTGSGPMQDLTGKVVAGNTYNLSARIKYDNANSPATKQFFATMHYGGSTYTNLLNVTAQRGQWATIQGSFTIPSTQSVATARIFFETPWVAGATATAAPDEHLMDFSIDEISLVGAPPPAPPSKTIEVVGKQPGDSNPLISHKFGADGFGYAEDGRVYMYMTNDTQGYAPSSTTGVSPQINYGQINQVTLISSEDMVNWTDHGEIQVAGPNGVAPFTNNSWAPGMAKKTVNGVDKYFLYYANGGGSSNVITGDSPLGPWKSERTSTLVNGSTPGGAGVAWPFDPAPFVDDDGQAYLYYGGGPAATSMPAAERFNNPKNIRVIELGADMVATSGSAAVVDAPVAFEAAQVFKREGLYYLSYSSHFGGNDFGGNQAALPGYPGGGQIGYMISDDPMDFNKDTYAGVMFPNQSEFFGSGTGGNNHQSVFELDGKYYFTYHAPTLNKAINGNTTQGYRSPHIQELQFNEDGTVKQVVGDYAGVEQLKNLDPYRTIEAETIAWIQGIATKKIDVDSQEFGAGAPNLALTDIDSGDWTALSGVDFGDNGPASVTAKVKPLAEGTRIEVRLDDRSAPVVATIEVDGTLGQWTEVTAALSGVSGVHDVYFTFDGTQSSDLLEVDTWAFEEGDGAPSLDVQVVAGQRCVAGKALPTVTVTNADDVTVAVSVTSPFSTKAFPAIAPDKSAFHAFTTRQASVPSGTLTATATAVVDGETVTTTQDVAFPAISCS